MSSKSSYEKEFKQYRDMAPEVVDDAKLRDVINKFGGNQEKITAAIENMWHDIPEKNAVGTNWESTSKPKKGTQPAVEPQNSRRAKPIEVARSPIAGRGGVRTAAVAGGRGAGARVSAPVSRPVTAREAPAAVNTASSGFGDESDEALPPRVFSAPVSASQPVVAAATGGATAWGAGGSLAAKLKRQQEAALNPPPVVTIPESEDEPEVAAEDIVVGRAHRIRKARAPRATSASVPDSEITIEDITELEIREVIEELEQLEILEEVVEELSTLEAAIEEMTSQIPLEIIETFIIEEVESEEEEQEQQQSEIEFEVIIDVPFAEIVLELTPEEPVVVPAPAPAPVPAPAPAPVTFVKMGKWETISDLADSGAFQFGSFGSFGTPEESPAEASGPPAVAPTPIVSSGWGVDADSTADPSNVWGTSQGDSTSSSLPPGMNSLFPPASKGLPLVSESVSGSSANRFDQKTSAPPGLEAHQNKNQYQAARNAAPGAGQQGRGKQHEAGLQHLQQQPLQHLNQQYQQQQYQQQPPGIPLGGARGAASAAVPPQGYYPGFDLNQPQYMHQPTSYGVPVSSVAPAATTSTTSTTTPGATASTASLSAQQQQQQQQQQFAPPPGMTNPYGYYPNPYYPNQYFYNQPSVPYYNPNRGYPARQYGDHYAAGGSVYQDVYQGQGQFPDSNYGAGQMHPGMQGQGQGQQAQGVPAAGSVGGATTSKQAKGVAPGVTGGAPGLNPQDPSAAGAHGYNYNPYPRSGAEQSWSQQQQQQQYQGGQWMFPNAPAANVGGPGLSQQGQGSAAPGFNQSGSGTLAQQGQQGGNRDNQRAPAQGAAGAAVGYGSSAYNARNPSQPTW